MRKKIRYMLVISLVISSFAGIVVHNQITESEAETLPDLKLSKPAGHTDKPEKIQFKGKLPRKDEVTIYKVTDRTNKENQISEHVFPKEPSEFPHIPSDERCYEVAKTYAEKVNWLEENLIRYEVGYAEIQITPAHGENKGDTFGGKIYASVSLARKIDGTPVPEDRVRVRVGNEGKILKISKEWSNLKKLGSRELMNPKVAFQRYFDTKGLPTKNRENILSVTLENIKIEYHIRSGYLRPFFKAETTITQEDGDQYFIPSIVIPCEK